MENIHKNYSRIEIKVKIDLASSCGGAVSQTAKEIAYEAGKNIFRMFIGNCQYIQ